MKVLMISRATLFSSPGGDTIQVQSTAKYLRKQGIEVDIRLANDSSIDYLQCDLLHLFNIIRPNDLLQFALKSGKPFVLSTIYVDYSEFERKCRGGLFGMLSKVLDKHRVEYLKVIARAVINNERIVSPAYWFLGQKRSISILLRKASFLLPNSENEMERIKKDFGLHNRCKIIPNAIDIEQFRLIEPAEKREGVICVARIEGLKNQLNLIKAMEGLDIPLTIIGKVAPNHRKYFEKCNAIAGKNVRFLNHIPQHELRLIYSRAKVHILPSWFETTGLSSLEAAYMGCNIVVTRKGDTEDYFGDYATYCEPDDITSIRKAILEAYHRPFSEALRQRITQAYTWNVAAQKTLEAYQAVLS